MAESKSTDWRKLCAAAAQEQDAAKLTRLVNQLIRAIDESFVRPPASCTATDENCAQPGG
jgi:hypothetical protein